MIILNEKNGKKEFQASNDNENIPADVEVKNEDNSNNQDNESSPETPTMAETLKNTWEGHIGNTKGKKMGRHIR